jgi:hypothetical protein
MEGVLLTTQFLSGGPKPGTDTENYGTASHAKCLQRTTLKALVNSGSPNCPMRAFWSLYDDVVYIFFVDNSYMFVSFN